MTGAKRRSLSAPSIGVVERFLVVLVLGQALKREKIDGWRLKIFGSGSDRDVPGRWLGERSLIFSCWKANPAVEASLQNTCGTAWCICVSGAWTLRGHQSSQRVINTAGSVRPNPRRGERRRCLSAVLRTHGSQSKMEGAEPPPAKLSQNAGGVAETCCRLSVSFKMIASQGADGIFDCGKTLRATPIG